MRSLLLLASLLLAACDGGSAPSTVNKDIAMDPLTDINARLAFTCRHETLPEPSADADVLFKYARWLQVNNQLKEDTAVDKQVERLYRIAAADGHVKAGINLLNGALRGHFSVSGAEQLRMSQGLIDKQVATGYYFIAIYLQYGAGGLKKDEEKALRYYRKAADEGSALAQASVGNKLFQIEGTGDVARQMWRCAAEQGEGDVASSLGVNLKGKGRYQEAIEAFQLGVAAGTPSSASFLENGFNGPEPTDDLYYLGQQHDPERVSRYKKIWKILSDYAYAHPGIPEINDIVPLPPAPLPVWDGKVKWVEARKANVQPTKPNEALIAKLARQQQLNPATGRPLPSSANFDKEPVAKLLCQTGEPCPKSGYWQIAWLPYRGISKDEILYVDEGTIMPTDTVVYYQHRIWPLGSKRIEQQQQVHWRFLTEA
ncbi:MAG TPA: DUF6396 domain-containing protein [Enterobacteriaceae bacterium]|nr:DUF6396 domain-containing protein [Enterobacteriaceae bacterium]